jgi:hypothetical protein
MTWRPCGKRPDSSTSQQRRQFFGSGGRWVNGSATGQILPRDFTFAFGKDSFGTIAPDRTSAVSAMCHEIKLLASQGDGNQIAPAGWPKLRDLGVLGIGDQRAAGRQATREALHTFRTIVTVSGRQAPRVASRYHGD